MNLSNQWPGEGGEQLKTKAASLFLSQRGNGGTRPPDTAALAALWTERTLAP